MFLSQSDTIQNQNDYNNLIVSCQKELIEDINNTLHEKLQCKLKPIFDNMKMSDKHIEIASYIQTLIKTLPDYKIIEQKYQSLLKENKALKEQLLNKSSPVSKNMVKLSIHDLSNNIEHTPDNTTHFKNLNIKMPTKTTFSFDSNASESDDSISTVSYTHLTLPTKRIV